MMSSTVAFIALVTWHLFHLAIRFHPIHSFIPSFLLCPPLFATLVMDSVKVLNGNGGTRERGREQGIRRGFFLLSGIMSLLLS